MDRILKYRVKDSDLDKTVGGILVKVLKHCMGLTPHEISHAKFTPGGITVLRDGKLRTVGRLDKDTSGAILFAKNAPAASRLFRQKDNGLFRKTYLAVTDNPPEENEKNKWNVIDSPIGPVPGTLMKQQIIESPEGKNALTRYICCEERDGISVIIAEIDTGRTHQIRVHMASIGHPLIGDKM